MVPRETSDSRSPEVSGKSRWRGKLALLVVLAGMVGGGIGFWKGYLEDRIIPKRWGEVVPGKVYRSGQLSAALVERMLREHEIGVVIDLTGGGDERDQVAEARAIRELGIESLLLALAGDGTGDIRTYAEAVERLQRATGEGKRVLVHCAAGAQRAGGVIAIYRALIENRSPIFIFEEMQRYDWEPGDDRAVVDFLNDHMIELARLLVEKKVIDKVPEPLPVLLAEAE